MDSHYDEAAELLEMGMSLASVSGAGFDKLTEMQRRFAALYVVHGGNGLEAAKAAGYAHPEVASCRVRLNPKVADLIQLLSLADARATMPVAVAVLVDIATGHDVDPETKRIVYRATPSERRKAALDLIKIAGGFPSAGPSVAVQVNTNQSGEGSSSATVVIQNVWNARSQRLGRLSGIAAPMPDSFDDESDRPWIEGEG